MSVSEMQNNKWPVVSIPNGADGAERSCKAALEWLESFDEVVICFDADAPGQKASTQVAQLLSPGKARIATLPLKDANAMLQEGRGKDLLDCLWQARIYRPDGIVAFGELHERITREPELGLSYPWQTLTDLTYGIRLDELVAVGSGTGQGKSEFMKQIAWHLLVEHKQTVGLLFLEEAIDHTAKGIMSKQAGKLFHIPDEKWTREEFEQAYAEIAKTDRLHLYDHFGANDWDTIRAKIKFMATGLGCKYIFLDHITLLVSGDRDNDERKQLDWIMTDLASLCRECHCNIHFVSHLTTPEGTSHEEGGRVTLRQFRGSRAIGQLTSFAIGLERDQQKPGSPTTARVLKDRYTGRATGKTFGLRYDSDTGLLLECSLDDAKDNYGMEAEDGEDY